MTTLRALAAIAALVLATPSHAAPGEERYTAKIKVTDGDRVVTNAMTSVEKGDPVRMELSHSARYGGESGPVVKTGFRFEMTPRLIGDHMQVEINLVRSEVTDSQTGALREEASVLQGDAKRDGDGWTYETDKLPGGKVLKVTFRDAPRPE